MRNFDFDFNSIEQITMGITLPNQEKTRLTLTVPKVSLIEKLSTNAEKIDKIFKEKNKSTINELYQIIADIMSCNKEFRKVTAEELKDCLLYEHVSAFVFAYMEFLTEIKSAKN
ncbi:MAG: hypothetical protein K2J71_04725 [Oscillospiraceae bacterium]|nr:hypothetical protein [Oscillospiraceae bacterium]